jgi:putative endonuclease
MIKNFRNELYVGISENPHERVLTHNKKLGAKFTKHKTAFRIVFLEKRKNLAEARKREIQIKKWRRDKKEMLIKKFSQGLETKI